MARFNVLLWPAFILATLIATAGADVTTGQEFILAFPCNGPTYSSSLVVINSNRGQVSVTVDSTVHDFVTVQKTVNGSSSLVIDFTDPHVALGLQVCDMNTPSQQGFRVITNNPVALYVYQAVFTRNNVTQFLVLPTNMLAMDYMGGANSRFGGIIVARQDGTRVTVGSTQVTLNRLDVYYSNAVTPVRANVPFAYILTSQSQMGFPYSSVMAMPKTYAAMQSSINPDVYGNPSMFQIWATQNNTQVTVNGGSVNFVNTGMPAEVGPIYGGGTVVASAPVQVLQYSTTLQYTIYPDMFLSANVMFYTNVDSSNSQLLIIAPIDSTGNIRLDGQAIPTLNYRRIPYSQYYYYFQPISGQAMLHTISITTLDDRFLAYVFYPYGSNAGTNYPVALNLPLTS